MALQATQNERPGAAAADLLLLLAGVILLIGFVLMPWLSMDLGGTTFSTTGSRFLLEEPAIDLTDRVFEAMMPQDEAAQQAFVRPVNAALSVIGTPDLVLLGAVIGILAGLWAYFDRPTREIAALAGAMGGMVALLYFVSFFAANRYSDIDVIGSMGLGFWVTLAAAVLLVLQAFLPRPAQITTARIAFFKQTLWNNRFFILILALLIVLPHGVAWITNSSPFPTARGFREIEYIAEGPASFWMAEFITIFSLAILVMSYNLMFGFTGVISFGHALFFGLGAYSVAVMAEHSDLGPDEAFVVAVAFTIVASALIGLIVGLASLRLRGIYFAIFTLAVAEAGFIFARNWDLTNKDDGGAIGTNSLPEMIDPIKNRLNLYYLALIAFVLVFVSIQKLVNSPTGSVFKAIRENEERAQAIGYSTIRFKLISIISASVMAGIAGVLFISINKSFQPTLFGVEHTVNSLLMTIIGGAGTLTGPVIGAASLDLINVQFRDSTAAVLGLQIGENWLLISGLIFVFVVLVFPFGIVGTWYRIQMWLKARRTDRDSTAWMRAATGIDDTTTGERQPSSLSLIEDAISEDAGD